MGATSFLGLLGGLALFLYGMQMMSEGLEAAAGNRMKETLEKLTANRLCGVAVGAGITAIIQSSSATTVMVVGFVNAGMMTLNQAVWIIMGANIGTTITGQLIALDVGALAPLFAFVGVVLIVFFKKVSFHNYGQIVAGLGVLFIGMEMMSSSMVPLRESPTFVNLLTNFTNPLFGLLAGMLFTAVIQSSSASVGILQALAMSGLIGLDGAVFVLFGQNIGTCITAILASVGTTRSAKRATIIHLMFNVIGATLFTIICIFTPLTSLVSSWTPNRPDAQIANMHTLFNIVTTILLLPFGNYFAVLAKKILPEVESESEGVQRLVYLQPELRTDDYTLGMSSILRNGIRNELSRMAGMVRENLAKSYDAVLTSDPDLRAEVREREEYIDFLNKEISRFISKMMIHEANAEDSIVINSYFRICSNLERVGDHAMNICDYSDRLNPGGTGGSGLSKYAIEEIKEMKDACVKGMDSLKSIKHLDIVGLSASAALEQRIDDMTREFRNNHLDRMHKGICADEPCILYTEMLTDFERIGDHILNIAEELADYRHER